MFRLLLLFTNSLTISASTMDILIPEITDFIAWDTKVPCNQEHTVHRSNNQVAVQATAVADEQHVHIYLRHS